MKRKVTLAIFENDLRLKISKYELSKDGSKIIVKSGGGANWSPSFDNNSFLEFPKKKWEIWKPKWTRIYFVKKKGSDCVNFNTEKVTGPSQEDLEIAVGATLLKDLGQEDKKPTWVSYVTLAFVVLTFLVVSGLVR